MTILPMPGEPVNMMWLNGSAVKALGSANSAPTTATSSSWKISPSMRVSSALVAGVISDILIITRLPAASAAISGPTAR